MPAGRSGAQKGVINSTPIVVGVPIKTGREVIKRNSNGFGLHCTELILEEARHNKTSPEQNPRRWLVY